MPLRAFIDSNGKIFRQAVGEQYVLMPLRAFIDSNVSVGEWLDLRDKS